MKCLDGLSETEVLALAISNEEEDSRIYADFGHSLRDDHPSTATMFVDMAAEEGEHRRLLIDLFGTPSSAVLPIGGRTNVRRACPEAAWRSRRYGGQSRASRRRCSR